MKKDKIKNGYVNIDLTKILDVTTGSSLTVGATSMVFTQDAAIISEFISEFSTITKSKKPYVATLKSTTYDDGTHTLAVTDGVSDEIVCDVGLVITGASNNVIRIAVPNLFCIYDSTNTRYLRAITINGANLSGNINMIYAA